MVSPSASWSVSGRPPPDQHTAQLCGIDDGWDGTGALHAGSPSAEIPALTPFVGRGPRPTPSGVLAGPHEICYTCRDVSYIRRSAPAVHLCRPPRYDDSVVTLRTVLRVGSCRFTAYYWITCALGLLAAGLGTAPWLAFTFLFWLVYCLATELLNRLTDRVEDAVNRPERTALCATIGFARIETLATTFYLLLFALAVLWVALAPSVALALFLTLNLLLSYNYSRGLRLKARRRMGTVALMALVTTPLLTGWSSGGTTASLLEVGVPLMMVIALFFGGLVGIKDITDIAGDRAIGYSSIWVAIAASPRRLLLMAATAVPFVLLLGLVVDRVLPSRMAFLTLFAPLSVAIVAAAAQAMSSEERNVAREGMYHHTALFLAMTLALYHGTPEALIAGALGLGAWLLASRHFHWICLITRRTTRAWLGLLGLRPARSMR